MMNKGLEVVRYVIRHSVVVSLASVVASTFMACSFERPGTGPDGISLDDGIQPREVNLIWDNALVTRITQKRRFTTFEDNLIRVDHGQSCSKANKALFQDGAGDDRVGIRVDESAPMPSGYDAATVFLNGWRLVYDDKDHHVQGLGTAIFDIEQDNQDLRWKAGGVISDKNGDDSFHWCYAYTIIFMHTNPLDLDVVPVDSDDRAELTFGFPDGYDGETSSLRRLNASVRDGIDAPRALLPRGFGVMLTGKDRHLAQFALKYGDARPVEASRRSGGSLLWEFQTIFKDDATRHAYTAYELVSTLNGDSVSVDQPDFSIRPRPRSCDIELPDIGESQVNSQTIVVANVPYDYAVPMLTGWDIGTVCGDHHIRDIGVWIESFEYDQISRRLTYTIKSRFIDSPDIIQSKGEQEPRYQVSILGFDAKGIISTGPTSPPSGLYTQ